MLIKDLNHLLECLKVNKVFFIYGALKQNKWGKLIAWSIINGTPLIERCSDDIFLEANLEEDSIALVSLTKTH